MNVSSTWNPASRPGWLAGSRVRHRRTGALGTVRGDGDRLLPQRWPFVAWDHGATIRHSARDLERSPDDWLSRAVTS